MLRQEVSSLLVQGSFILKKWVINRVEVLAKIPARNCAQNPFLKPKNEHAVKVLGLHWNLTLDYHVNINEVIPAKRSILPTIARLFDLIGTLGPVVFWA